MIFLILLSSMALLVNSAVLQSLIDCGNASKHESQAKQDGNINIEYLQVSIQRICSCVRVEHNWSSQPTEYLSAYQKYNISMQMVNTMRSAEWIQPIKYLLFAEEKNIPFRFQRTNTQPQTLKEQLHFGSGSQSSICTYPPRTFYPIQIPFQFPKITNNQKRKSEERTKCVAIHAVSCKLVL